MKSHYWIRIIFSLKYTNNCCTIFVLIICHAGAFCSCQRWRETLRRISSTWSNVARCGRTSQDGFFYLPPCEPHQILGVKLGISLGRHLTNTNIMEGKWTNLEQSSVDLTQTPFRTSQGRKAARSSFQSRPYDKVLLSDDRPYIIKIVRL